MEDMLRLSCVVCLFVLLSACGGKKQSSSGINIQKMQESLKDTLCDREISPEEGAARLQALSRLYTDKTSWEVRKKCLQEGFLNALELNPALEKNPIVPVYARASGI